MSKVVGANLGNWLVLEKWMNPSMFVGTEAEDEVWLSRLLPKDELSAKLKTHRDSYIGEEDFAFLKAQGFDYVRIPVPYFIFGDREPFPGCVEYLDKAFDWAEKHDIKILIDLHTVPKSQNGYDNGGITGVCKWCKDPEEVEFVLTVLERLAARFGDRKGLYGIEIVNEPISWIVYATAPSTGKAKDKEEAKGSGYVPMKFLKPFYLEAYRRLRAILPEDKVIVFHDGFRLTKWGSFFKKNKLVNVAVDTHIYLFALELFFPIRAKWIYKIFLNICMNQVKRIQKNVPVLIGEWCVSTKYCYGVRKKGLSQEEIEAKRLERFRAIAEMEVERFAKADGTFYWSYRLLKDPEAPFDVEWKEAWDLSRCLKKGYLNKEDIQKLK